jgi:hypothetical protein
MLRFMSFARLDGPSPRTVLLRFGSLILATVIAVIAMMVTQASSSPTMFLVASHSYCISGGQDYTPSPNNYCVGPAYTQETRGYSSAQVADLKNAVEESHLETVPVGSKAACEEGVPDIAFIFPSYSSTIFPLCRIKNWEENPALREAAELYGISIPEQA